MDTLTRIRLLGKICDRARDCGLTKGKMRSRTLFLDLEYATDGKGKPPSGRNGNLNLEALLNEDESDFSHDILGIYTHINRDATADIDVGEMRDCFVPRCGFVNENGE